MRKLFYWVLVIALIIALAVEEYEHRHPESPNSYEVVDSITTKEVVPDTAPIPRDSVVLRYEYVKIPLTHPPESTPGQSDTALITESVIAPPNDGNDSVNIAIPITQKGYETEEYRAYVSGYKASLDSIFTFRQKSVVRIREPTKHKRFSVGIQAGYGMTPKGFQPYVGVGVSVNLFSF